jgi:hypothetical protein
VWLCYGYLRGVGILWVFKGCGYVMPVNYTTVCVKELDPKYSGVYIDSFLLLIFGGIG